MPFYPLLFLFSFGWFLAHLVPTCYYGDCPEILTAILTHGVPHPTGFPFYLLLTTLAASLNADAIWVNAVSALASAFSTVLFVGMMERLMAKPGPPASPWLKTGWAFIFLSSSTLLLHSSMARVYPLSLTALLATLAWAVFFPPRDKRALMGLGFLWGLAAGTHMLFVTAFPFLVILFWDQRETILRRLPYAAAGFILALSLYLWIPLLSHQNPVLNWTHPDHYQSLRDYLTQKAYHTKMDSRDPEGSLVFLVYFVKWLTQEWPFYLWAAAGAGFFILFKTSRQLFWALTALMYMNLLVIFAYGTEKDLYIGYRYFLPFYFGMAAGMAWGLRWLFDQLTVRWAPIAITCFLGAGCFLFQIPRAELARSTTAYDYAVNLMKAVPRGGTMVIQGDNQVFPVAYAALVAHARPDIHYLEFNGFFFPGAKREIDQTPKRGLAEMIQVFFKESGDQLYLSYENPGMDSAIMEPDGLYYRMTSPKVRKKLGDAPDPLKILRLRNLSPRMDDVEAEEILAEYPLLSGAHKIWERDFKDAERELDQSALAGSNSVHTLNNVSALYTKLGDLKKARVCLEKALLLEPHLPLAHLNLGILYAKMGLLQEAQDQTNEALRLDPGNRQALDFYLKLRNYPSNPSKSAS